MRDEKNQLLEEVLANGDSGIDINKIIDALYDIEELHKKLELNDEFNAAIDKIATKVRQPDAGEEKEQLTARLNGDIQKYKTNKGKVHLIRSIADRSDITLDNVGAIIEEEESEEEEGEEEEEDEEQEEIGQGASASALAVSAARAARAARAANQPPLPSQPAPPVASSASAPVTAHNVSSPGTTRSPTRSPTRPGKLELAADRFKGYIQYRTRGNRDRSDIPEYLPGARPGGLTVTPLDPEMGRTASSELPPASPSSGEGKPSRSLVSRLLPSLSPKPRSNITSRADEMIQKAEADEARQRKILSATAFDPAAVSNSSINVDVEDAPAPEGESVEGAGTMSVSNPNVVKPKKTQMVSLGGSIATDKEKIQIGGSWDQELYSYTIDAEPQQVILKNDTIFHKKVHIKEFIESVQPHTLGKAIFIFIQNIGDQLYMGFLSKYSADSHINFKKLNSKKITKNYKKLSENRRKILTIRNFCLLLKLYYLHYLYYIYDEKTFQQSDLYLNDYRVKNNFFIEDPKKLKFYNLLCLDLFFSMIEKLDKSISLENREKNILDILPEAVQTANIENLIISTDNDETIEGYEFANSFIKTSGCKSFAGYYYLKSENKSEDDKERYYEDHNDNKFKPSEENFDNEFTALFDTKLKESAVLFNNSNMEQIEKYSKGYLINLLSREELLEIHKLLYKIMDLPPV